MAVIYATLADLVTLCGEQELYELRPSTTGLGFDQVAAQQAIDAATAVVDSYVGQVYSLPLQGCERQVAGQLVTEAPPLLKHVTLDIARFALHRDLSETHEVARRHKQARSDLEMVARGKQALVCPWGGSPGVKLQGAVAAQDPGTDAYSATGAVVSDLDDALRGF